MGRVSVLLVCRHHVSKDSDITTTTTTTTITTTTTTTTTTLIMFSTRYSTLFTMPYLLVAHYHETDSIQCEDSWFLRQIRALLRSIQVFPS